MSVVCSNVSILLLLLSSGCEIAEAITLGSNECSEKTGVTEGRSEILPDVNEAPPMALLDTVPIEGTEHPKEIVKDPWENPDSLPKINFRLGEEAPVEVTVGIETNPYQGSRALINRKLVGARSRLVSTPNLAGKRLIFHRLFSRSARSSN